MGIVSRTPKPSNSNLLVFGAGKVISAAEVNADVQTLFTVVNGNLDTTNLSPAAGVLYSQLVLTDKILNSDINTAAAIDAAKLLDLSILSGKIAASAITTAKVATNAISKVATVASTTPKALELVSTPYQVLGDAALKHTGFVIPVTCSLLWWFTADVSSDEASDRAGYLMWRFKAFDGAATTLDPAGGAAVGYTSHRTQAGATSAFVEKDNVGRKVIMGLIPVLAAGTYSFEMEYEVAFGAGADPLEWTFNGTDIGPTPGVAGRSSLAVLALYR